MADFTWGLYTLASGYLSGLTGDMKSYVQVLRLKYPFVFIPPDLVFPIVWTFLYYNYGVFLYSVAHNGKRREDNILLKWSIVGLVLNLLWTPVFLVNIRTALIILLGQIISCCVVIYMLLYDVNVNIVKSKYAILRPLQSQIVYLTWLCFALYLNYNVMFNNPVLAECGRI